MNFIIYDNRTGEILRSCFARCIEDVAQQIRAGHEEILMGEADQATQHVVDGVIVDRAPPPGPVE